MNQDFEFEIACGSCRSTVLRFVIWAETAEDAPRPMFLCKQIALRCTSCAAIMIDAEDDATAFFGDDFGI